MKKIVAFIMVVLLLFSFTACNLFNKESSQDADGKEIAGDQSKTGKSNKADSKGLIADEYKDSHELYAFVKTFLDRKEPVMEKMKEKRGEYQDTVSALAGSDFGIDLPVQGIGYLSALDKAGESWQGTSGVFEYDITKSGDKYSFTITHTMLDAIAEGTLDMSKGEIQLTENSPSNVTKYQVKAFDSTKYLRFWSEKSEYLDETRAHYTYLNGDDVAVGQEETITPKELIGSNYKDDTYVENDEGWVKLINGKTSDFDGINS